MVVELSKDEANFLHELVSHKIDNLRNAYKHGIVPLDDDYKRELNNLLALDSKLKEVKQ